MGLNREYIIAGNWKMNCNKAQTRELLGEIIKNSAGAACKVVVCVPFTSLETAAQMLKENKSVVKLGAQNVAWAQKGAFTGEISVDMLKEIGVEYAIIGHSERRQYFGETDDTVNARVKAALAGGLIPIICVGETLNQRESGKTNDVCNTQIRAAFKDISADAIAAGAAVIAYEPVWAIGTGKTATDDDANDTIAFIRSVVADIYDAKVADGMQILYGGSMNAGNAAGLLAMQHIDGGLVGGASLKAQDFALIVNSAKK